MLAVRRCAALRLRFSPRGLAPFRSACFALASSVIVKLHPSRMHQEALWRARVSELRTPPQTHTKLFAAGLAGCSANAIRHAAQTSEPALVCRYFRVLNLRVHLCVGFAGRQPPGSSGRMGDVRAVVAHEPADAQSMGLTPGRTRLRLSPLCAPEKREPHHRQSEFDQPQLARNNDRGHILAP